MVVCEGGAPGVEQAEGEDEEEEGGGDGGSGRFNKGVRGRSLGRVV